LSQLCEWGAIVWIKRLDAGKLDPRAEEARFVGYDDESKGFRIYWPKKRKVSVERDMYFDKNRALEPDEASIEGEEDVFTQPDTSQPRSTTPDDINNPLAPVNNNPNDPAPASIDNVAENLPATPNVSTETLETPSNAPIPPPHQRTMRRNSLAGLTPVDETQYGRGKRNRVPTSCSAAKTSRMHWKAP
jgi:hypothetical protein